MLADVMLLYAGNASPSVVKFPKSRKKTEKFCIVRLVPTELFIRKTGGLFLLFGFFYYFVVSVMLLISG